MSDSDAPPTLVVVNPQAGGVAGSDDLADTLAPLGPARIVETSGPGHARELAARARNDGVRRVVVVGGDGTLHEVVDALDLGWDFALGIIPAGTGNDTARSLEIPLDLDEAVRLIAEGEARATDVISVEVDGEAERAINAACGGFGGEVNERMTDELKDRWGPLAYIRTAVEALSNVPVYRVRVRVDEAEPEELAVHSLVVANGPFAARGVYVAPGAVPDDGLLAVHAVLEAPAVKLMGMLPSVMRGQAPESEHYRVWSGSRVEIDAAEPMDVSVDGELRTGRRFRYEAIRGALDVHRP